MVIDRCGQQTAIKRFKYEPKLRTVINNCLQYDGFNKNHYMRGLRWSVTPDFWEGVLSATWRCNGAPKGNADVPTSNLLDYPNEESIPAHCLPESGRRGSPETRAVWDGAASAMTCGQCPGCVDGYKEKGGKQWTEPCGQCTQPCIASSGINNRLPSDHPDATCKKKGFIDKLRADDQRSTIARWNYSTTPDHNTRFWSNQWQVCANEDLPKTVFGGDGGFLNNKISVIEVVGDGEWKSDDYLFKRPYWCAAETLKNSSGTRFMKKGNKAPSTDRIAQGPDWDENTLGNGSVYIEISSSLGIDKSLLAEFTDNDGSDSSAWLRKIQAPTTRITDIDKKFILYSTVIHIATQEFLNQLYEIGYWSNNGNNSSPYYRNSIFPVSIDVNSDANEVYSLMSKYFVFSEATNPDLENFIDTQYKNNVTKPQISQHTTGYLEITFVVSPFDLFNKIKNATSEKDIKDLIKDLGEQYIKTILDEENTQCLLPNSFVFDDGQTTLAWNSDFFIKSLECTIRMREASTVEWTDVDITTLLTGGLQEDKLYKEGKIGSFPSNCGAPSTDETGGFLICPLFKFKLKVVKPSNMLLLYSEVWGGINKQTEMVDFYYKNGGWTNLTYPSAYIKALQETSTDVSDVNILINKGCDFTILFSERNMSSEDGDKTLKDKLLVNGSSLCACIKPNILPSYYNSNEALQAAKCFDIGCVGGDSTPDSECIQYCPLVYDWISNTSPVDGIQRSQYLNTEKYKRVCGGDYSPNSYKSHNETITFSGIPLVIIIIIFTYLTLKNKNKTPLKITLYTIGIAIILFSGIWFVTTEMAGIDKCVWSEPNKPGKSVCYSKRFGIPISNKNCLYTQSCECTQADDGVDCKTLTNCTECLNTTCVNTQNDRDYEVTYKRELDRPMSVLCLLFSIFTPLLISQIYTSIKSTKTTFYYILLVISINIPLIIVFIDYVKYKQHTHYKSGTCPKVDLI